MNPKDRNTAVKLRGYKIRRVQQHRFATVSDRARWRAKLEEFWRPMTLAMIVQNKNHNLFWRMFLTWFGTSIVVVEECF